MRVLHLPVNIASQVSITVRALRDIGIEARGLVLNNSPIQGSEGIETYEVVSRRRHPVRGVLQTLPWWCAFQSAIRWADVVHWHFGSRVLPIDLDLKYIAFLNKARIVEFFGSDIRISEMASADNPYWAKMCQEYPELVHGDRERSLKTQRRFSQHGFECLCGGYELPAYIQEEMFPSPYNRIRARLIISDFDPKYPDPGERRPVVVHAPSHKAKKGTKAVLRAIDQLKCRYEFDFKLVHGVERSRALEIVRNCDIMVDQFIGGEHGVAALEAMAFGKPVLCYIKPSLVAKYPSDFPIVNANQDNLAQVLGPLLEDGQRRREIGRQSRAYVVKHHDAHQIARQLVTIYQELIEKQRGSKRE